MTEKIGDNKETEEHKFLRTCFILGSTLQDDLEFQKLKEVAIKKAKEQEKMKKTVMDDIYNRIQRPTELLQRRIDEMNFGTTIINETVDLIKKNGGTLPLKWSDYIAKIAKECNTNERRIRRIFRKAGFNMED